jgi:hypothetical protein
MKKNKQLMRNFVHIIYKVFVCQQLQTWNQRLLILL